MVQDGYYVNLGYPLNSSWRSRPKQVRNGENRPMIQWKSDLLIGYSETGKAGHMGKGQAEV